MNKKLLERGQWCVTIYEAMRMREDDSTTDIADMLMDGLTPYRKMKEIEVIEELRLYLNKEESPLVPYTLKELVEQAEGCLQIGI